MHSHLCGAKGMRRHMLCLGHEKLFCNGTKHIYCRLLVKTTIWITA